MSLGQTWADNHRPRGAEPGRAGTQTPCAVDMRVRTRVGGLALALGRRGEQSPWL